MRIAIVQLNWALVLSFLLFLLQAWWQHCLLNPVPAPCPNGALGPELIEFQPADGDHVLGAEDSTEKPSKREDI